MARNKIIQAVCLGVRVSCGTVAHLHIDKLDKKTRLRVYKDGAVLAGVQFDNTGETSFYWAVQRLSKKINRPIQYLVVYPLAVPLADTGKGT